MGSSVRVATYNIHHGADDRNRPSLDRIGAALSALHADVIGLQEVDCQYGDRSEWADQPAELAERLGMTPVFLPTIPHGEGGYGNAILSRFPVESRRLVPLPTTDGQEDRAATHVLLSGPGGPLHMVNTHLNHLPWDGAGRARQLAVLTDLIAKVRAETPAPLVLTGDFNAPPRRSELIAVRDVVNDSWLSLHRRLGWLSWLVLRAPGGTFPSIWPVRRIDYVYATPELVPVATHVPRGRASDHRPLVVELRLATGDARG